MMSCCCPWNWQGAHARLTAAKRSHPEFHTRLWIASALWRLHGGATQPSCGAIARADHRSLGNDPLFRTVDQPRRHADGGAAGRHVTGDERAGADLGKIADGDV